MSRIGSARNDTSPPQPEPRPPNNTTVVSGEFYPPVQPVSGPLTSDDLRLSDLSVLVQKVYDIVNRPASNEFIGDDSVARTFGNNDLRGQSGGIKAENKPQDVASSGFVSARVPIFSMLLNGYSSAIIQIAGTWTGTITFEVWPGGAGDVSTILGIPINTGIAATTTTANGTWRFNIVACQRIQVRFSTPTTGAPTVTIGASVNPLGIFPIQVAGASAILTQRATTYEQNTYDTNLATVLGLASLLSPGTLGTEVTRLKVAATGKDIGQPRYRNPDGTYQIANQDVPLFGLIEQLLTQQKITNNLLLELALSAGCQFQEFELRDAIKI
jgi:hypothetical protein